MSIETFFGVFRFLNIENKDFNPSPNEDLSFRERLQDFSLCHATHRTLEQPYPWSRTRAIYSQNWGYNVSCHPDTHRGPVPLFLHTVSLQILTVMALLYLMHLKGESKNYFRMLLYAVSPMVAVPMLVAPMLFGSLQLLQIVLNEAKNGDRSFAELLRDLKRVINDTIRDSCGTLLEPLPEQDLPLSADLTNTGKYENLGRDIPAVVAAQAKDSPPPRNLPTAIIAPALALLMSIAVPTLFLASRRFVLEGMILLDEYHVYLAFIAVLTTLHCLCILGFKPKSIHAVDVKLNIAESQSVSEAVDGGVTGQDSSDLVPDTAHPKPSMMLLIRSVCASHTPDWLRAKRHEMPYKLGQGSVFEIIFAELALSGMFRRNSDVEWHNFTFTVHRASWMFFTAGLFQIYVAFAQTVVSTLLHLTKRLAITIFADDSQVYRWLETAHEFWNDIPSKMSNFLTNIRCPQSLGWMIKNWYFGIWVFIFYPLFYYIMLDDISKLEDQKWNWGNESPCFFLWFDPLSETLLYPFYHFNGYSHPY